MQVNREFFRHYWAVAGILLLAFIAAFGRIYELYPPTTVPGFFLHLITVVMVGGFYVSMFVDCIASKSLRHRKWWLVFFIMLPILSAYIYFMTTRSFMFRRDSE